MESKVEIFKSKDNNIELWVAFDADTDWFSKEQMGDLFGRNRVTITQHNCNIFREGELDQQMGGCYLFYLCNYHNLLVSLKTGKG